MKVDLQSLFELYVTAVLIGWDPCTIPPIPRIGTRIRGRYWSAKIDDISPGQALWSVRECGMDNPFQLKSHQAGSLSSSQPGGPPWWVTSLACGLIVQYMTHTLLSDGKGGGIRTSTHSLTGSTGKPETDRDKLQWYTGRKRTRKKDVKGSEQWETRGVGKVANDRYWSPTVVIYVLFLFLFGLHLGIIIIPFPLNRAQ